MKMYDFVSLTKTFKMVSLKDRLSQTPKSQFLSPNCCYADLSVQIWRTIDAMTMVGEMNRNMISSILSQVSLDKRR
jgi:hypothetical protein